MLSGIGIDPALMDNPSDFFRFLAEKMENREPCEDPTCEGCMKEKGERAKATTDLANDIKE